MTEKLTDVTDNKVGKITDSEIIKALECCVNWGSTTSCADCPLCNTGCVHFSKLKETLDLISHQQAEIENLKDILYDAEGVNLVNYWYQQCEIAENGCRNFEEENKKLKAEIERLKTAFENSQKTSKYWHKKCGELVEEVQTAKTEAIKEFEYKLLDVSHLRIPQKIYPGDVRKIKKELVGEYK